MVAARQSFVLVLLCLDPRFDVKAKDIDGYTPLHRAALASEKLEPATFNLIQRGAIRNPESVDLRTPLHCAARGGESSIITMLLHFGTESGETIDDSTYCKCCRRRWESSTS
jgi:ankyrin repeat protein